MNYFSLSCNLVSQQPILHIHFATFCSWKSTLWTADYYSNQGNPLFNQNILFRINQADANVTITETDSGSFELFIKFGNSPVAYLAQHTGDKKAKAYRIKSNNPIAVSAYILYEFQDWNGLFFIISNNNCFR